ncbi:MAG: serine hydroxymethyltransferase, partial [Pseudonocardiaceae bacterium]
AVALKEAAGTDYKAYAAQVVSNSAALAKSLEDEGMRAVSGGTDTHLSLIDLRGLGVSGAEAEARAGAARITLNKNAIPYDPAPPMTASGIRVGTPAVTTQGMTEPEMAEIARLIGRAIRAERGTTAGDAQLAEIGEAVGALVAAKPAYRRN